MNDKDKKNNNTEPDAEEQLPPITIDGLRSRLEKTAFAFRGYNITNLGLTPELLERGGYAAILTDCLQRASAICESVTGEKTDLVKRVRDRQETDLSTYHEAISLIVAVEQAQMKILEECLDVPWREADMMYGYSLGEISALVAAGTLRMEDALQIPLAMSKDSMELAKDVTLAVLFTRARELPFDAVHLLCQKINAEGDGVIGVSALLAPNSMLLIGQATTLDRFKKRLDQLSSERLYLRRNDNNWPPLHTPIVWQRNIPNRSQHMMHTMRGGFRAPTPPVLSLATGELSYTDVNVRELIGMWIDHPQRLWDAIDKTLSRHVETVVHVGPQPNIIPATFERLANNVESQTKSFRMRALSGMVSRPWLKAVLPKRANLLRAPHVRHIMLEKWLLEQRSG